MPRALKLYQGIFGRVCLVDSNRNLVTHAHPQYHVLIKAGGADPLYRVGDDVHVLDDRSMILINPWQPHSKTHRAGDASSTVLALHIEPTWLADIGLDLPEGAAECFSSSCVAIPASIRVLVDRLLAGVADPDGSSRAHARWESALSELMRAIIHAFVAKPATAGIARFRARRISDPRIARAISFMENHLGESYSSEELARMHCLSRPHFFQLFKECTALSPALYMNMLRMEAALGGLAHDAVSIGQLSDTLGFSEPHHFTRFFRHNVGIPPTEYRRTVTVFKQTGRTVPDLSMARIRDISFHARGFNSANFAIEAAVS